MYPPAGRLVCVVLITVLALLLSVPDLLAQPSFTYSHFFFNPNLYNPAGAALDTYSSVLLLHKQQWMGMEGAPAVSALNASIVTRARFAWGANVVDLRQGLFKFNSFSATAAYRLQLGTDQFVIM